MAILIIAKLLPKGISRLWLPILVAVLGVATTVSAWERLQRERHAREAGTLEVVAADSRRALEAASERQFGALLDLAASWGRFGPRSLEAWRFEAGRTLEIFPGLFSLAWVDSDGEVVRIAGSQEPRALPDSSDRRALEALAQRVETRRGILMDGPHHESGLGHVYDLVVPAFDESGRAGVLVARVSVQRMLESIFRDSAPGYAVSVHWGGVEIFQRGTAGRAHAKFVSREPVEFSPSVLWEATYVPTQARIDASLSPWPNYFLGGGILISIMLGVLIYQLRSAEGAVRSLDDLNQELERRVGVRTRELAGAVLELEAFNYSVSHDLRSPLGSILTFSAVLEEDFGDRIGPEALEMLGRIRGSAETSMRLLEGLLELSRAGRADLHLQRTNVGALAREVWAEVATGSEGDVQLEIGDMPDTWGDPVLLRQVLANLLRNALKFSQGREKPRIVLRGHGEGGEDVYSVADNGVGFDMRFANKLFQPFERLHGESEFTGAGVGLAIVRRIVERHGGRVWAEGKDQAGATFFFALPARRPS